MRNSERPALWELEIRPSKCLFPSPGLPFPAAASCQQTEARVSAVPSGGLLSVTAGGMTVGASPSGRWDCGWLSRQVQDARALATPQGGLSPLAMWLKRSVLVRASGFAPPGASGLDGGPCRPLGMTVEQNTLSSGGLSGVESSKLSTLLRSEPRVY